MTKDVYLDLRLKHLHHSSCPPISYCTTFRRLIAYPLLLSNEDEKKVKDCLFELCRIGMLGGNELFQIVPEFIECHRFDRGVDPGEPWFKASATDTNVFCRIRFALVCVGHLNTPFYECAECG